MHIRATIVSSSSKSEISTFFEPGNGLGFSNGLWDTCQALGAVYKKLLFVCSKFGFCTYMYVFHIPSVIV